MNSLLYLLHTKARLVRLSPAIIKHRRLARGGFCNVCGHRSWFLANHAKQVETLLCVYCGSWLRIRHLVQQVIDTYSIHGSSSLKDLVREEQFKSLAIFEAQAFGPMHYYLKKCPGYICSEYYAGREPGSYFKGVRVENMETLTFSDNSFDLYIHTAVLEHIRKPELALPEMARVVKPGGYMIFEVPIAGESPDKLQQQTTSRVDTSGEEDIFLVQPAYHADPLNKKGGALVYTDWGMDIVNQLQDHGFAVEPHILFVEAGHPSHTVAFVCRLSG